MIRAIRGGLRSFGDPDKGLFVPVLGFPLRISHSFWLVAGIAALQQANRPATALLWLLILVLSRQWVWSRPSWV